jgi:hypothetical protein
MTVGIDSSTCVTSAACRGSAGACWYGATVRWMNADTSFVADTGFGGGGASPPRMSSSTLPVDRAVDLTGASGGADNSAAARANVAGSVSRERNSLRCAS